MHIEISEQNLDILIELLEKEIRYLERKERIVTGDELQQLKIRLLMHLYPMVITFKSSKS